MQHALSATENSAHRVIKGAHASPTPAVQPLPIPITDPMQQSRPQAVSGQLSAQPYLEQRDLLPGDHLSHIASRSSPEETKVSGVFNDAGSVSSPMAPASPFQSSTGSSPIIKHPRVIAFYSPTKQMQQGKALFTTGQPRCAAHRTHAGCTCHRFAPHCASTAA